MNYIIKAGRVHRKGGPRKTKRGLVMVRPHMMLVGEQHPYAREAVTTYEKTTESTPKEQEQLLKELSEDTTETLAERRDTDVEIVLGVDASRIWYMEAKEKYGTLSYLGDVGIREVIQNSVDAVLKALDNKQMKKGIVDLKITDDARGFDVTDNGTGMSSDTIANKFLLLGATGKDVQGQVGGFGIAKAVILGPTQKTKWELWSNEYYCNTDLATAGLRGAKKKLKYSRPEEVLKGTKIQVRSEKQICTTLSKQYYLTTEVPKNLEMSFSWVNERTGERELVPHVYPLDRDANGKKLRFEEMTNHFVTKKEVLNPATDKYEPYEAETNVKLRYYPKPPKEYSGMMVIRLVDKKTGAKYTQHIRSVSSVDGCFVCDLDTTETPSGKYPLTDSRMNFRWGEVDEWISHEIGRKQSEPLSSARAGITQKSYSIKSAPGWGKTVAMTKVDPTYLELKNQLIEGFREEGLRKGAGSLDEPDFSKIITPIENITIDQDIGYEGTKGGTITQAKILSAYEGLFRLYGTYLKEKVFGYDNVNPDGPFVGLLIKRTDKGIKMAHHSSGTGEIGLNYKDIPDKALENPVTVALWIQNVVQHELTHTFVGPHDENFTGTLMRIQEDTARLFPHALRAAGLVLGQNVDISINKRNDGPVKVHQEPTFDLHHFKGWKQNFKEEYLYILSKKGVDPALIQEQVDDLINMHVGAVKSRPGSERDPKENVLSLKRYIDRALEHEKKSQELHERHMKEAHDAEQFAEEGGINEGTEPITKGAVGYSWVDGRSNIRYVIQPSRRRN